MSAFSSTAARLRVASAFAVLSFSACPKSSPAEAPVAPEVHRDEEAHDALPDRVAPSPEVVARAGIRTTPVRRAPLPETLTLIGELRAVPDRSARLSSTVAGRLDEVRFNEGQTVKRGDVLALVRVPDVGRLRGALAAAQSRARAARANAERLRPLKESGLEAEQVLLNAEADARVEEAEAKALTEQLSAMGADSAGTGFVISVRAPISGVVVSRDAVVGQPISADAVLGSVVDLSELWFLGRVFEKDLARLRVGASTEVEFNAFPDEHFHGAVDYVSQQLDPVARTLTARIRLDNADHKLRLGLFGRAHVDVSRGEGAPQLLVPRDAVFEIDGKRVVFVKEADGDYVLHTVTLGASALDDVQVLAGVSEGEAVVSAGGFTLKSLLLKSTLAEDE